MSIQLAVVPIEKPDPSLNLILGHSHFIKTIEDVYEALVNIVPGIKFGLAFCEASGPRLIRSAGTDTELTRLAEKTAQSIGAGHSFVIFLGNAFPINVLNAVKLVPEVACIFCATANPVQVIVGETEQGRGILGVIDGEAPLGIEDEAAMQKRKDFLRQIGYKM